VTQRTTTAEENQGLIALLVTRPVAVTMLFLAALVFGFVSYKRLPVELMPDISYPTITVRTTFGGAAPQEVESQISQPIEEALATLDGLVTLESRSRAGTSDVVLGFDWGTDMAASAQSIREALQTTFLPEDADRPLILRYDPSLEPFMRLALSTDPTAVTTSPEQSLFVLREVAEDEIQRRLEGMKGVAAVRVRGGLEREVRIAVHDDWLVARNVTLEDVRNVLRGENVNVAGGQVLEGDTEYLVRTVAQFGDVSDIRALQIRRADGVLVPITDVADITDTHTDRTVVTHLDGVEAVELEIFKEADANIVEVAGQVQHALDGDDVGYTQADVDKMPPGKMREAMQSALDGSKGLTALLPPGVKLAVLDDSAGFIELAIDNLRDSVLIGGVLAICVLFLFLRDYRATAIIGVSIPISLLIGFGPLYIADVSLNLMSLGGLALGVGMLVDNSVVVLESIQQWLDEGMNRRDAAVHGTTEVAAAVFASTMTTVAVFIPIAFIEGVGGELFGDLAHAVVWSLMASLAVALFMVPMLAALGGGASTWYDTNTRAWQLDLSDAAAELADGMSWAQANPKRMASIPLILLRWALSVGGAVGAAIARTLFVVTVRLLGAVWVRVATPSGRLFMWFADGFNALYNRFASGYAESMHVVVRRPWSIVGASAVLFAITVQVLLGLGTELLPEVHQGRFTIDVALPVGTPLARTTDVVTQAEKVIAATPDVGAVYTTIGTDARDDTRPDAGEHSARIRVQLKADGDGDLAEREERAMTAIRRELVESVGLSAQFSRPALFSFRTPIEVVVHGEDLERLRATGDQLVASLGGLPSLADVKTSLKAGNPEVQIRYDRVRLARLGLDTATVAERLRDRIQGVVATELHGGTDRVDLRVQLDARERGSIRDLRRVNINPSIDPVIPLDAVATLTEAIGPSEIRRVDQRRAVVLSANLVGFDMGGAIDDVTRTLRRAPFDADQTWEMGGQARELSSSGNSLLLALGLAIFLVYVVMASTFENLLHPLVILLTVPLALFGVAGGLAFTGLPLSVPAFMGVIVLAGVVVNNAIVLVDATNRLRDDGEARLSSVEHAAALRLRPILITAITTVLGLLPLAFGFGAGIEVQRPLAVTVVGGMATATLLTLVVIPAVYVLVTGGTKQDAP
jgi:HAE1 family hydrophobic/amphiphilic exporter-1